jgi:cell fate regulator YaaT (PSP1 superfamily)
MTPADDDPDALPSPAHDASGDAPGDADARNGDTGADGDGDGDGDGGADGDAPGTAGSEAGPRKRRRRRRRRSEAAIPGAEPAAGHITPGPAVPPGARAQSPARPPAEATPAPGGPDRGQRASTDPATRGRDDRGPGRGRSRRERAAERRGDRGPEARGERDREQRAHGSEPGGRGGDPQPRGNEPRADRSGDPRADRNADRNNPRGDRSGDPRADRSSDRNNPRGDRSAPRADRTDPRTRGSNPPQEPRGAASDARGERYALLTPSFEGPTTRLDPRRPVAPTDDLDIEGPTTPAIPWGKDDDGPPADVVLAADLPADAPADDPDPVSYPLLELPSAPLGDDVASVAGVRFVPGGRVQWCDAGDADYARGERVMVDADRGTRLAWIAVPPARRAVRDRGMRRVIRRAGEQDLRGERDGDTDRAHALRVAKDKAAALRLPLKVFRVELLGQSGRSGRLNVYYTTDERLDLRDFIRDVSSALGGVRVELRQLGVRDEAKAVGGIGSCGLTLCCTTWLPDFVPVSIKMAKDQGLVLSPTKVSGQCGRLKCCLVYEQAAYAELRKGLPKLGKRVIAARGEGRVVEVDVLRQRIRVSYGPGDTEVMPATEVKPLFPSGNQPAARSPGRDDRDDTDDRDDADDSSTTIDLPASVDGAVAPSLDDPDDGALPDDDPSSAT